MQAGRERMGTELMNHILSLLPPVARLIKEKAALEKRVAALEPLQQAAPPAPQTWAPPGHFYSPIVDPADEHARRAMASEEAPIVTPESMGLDSSLMREWFRRIALHYPTHRFPETPSLVAGAGHYFYQNPNFPLADALALLAVMVTCKPRRLIEVGSGYSSCAAIDITDGYLQGRVEMTFIEPHPELALEMVGSTARFREGLLKQKLQDVPVETFLALERGDILFIDSSHVVKTGSDVVDYVFRILPRLQAGVLVHIHDIFYPFEYPRAWIADENRSWNEAYLLRAFLHKNRRFQVFYMSDWIYKCERELMQQLTPLCVTHRGGSLWMEVVD